MICLVQALEKLTREQALTLEPRESAPEVAGRW